MQITLNGKPHELPRAMNISELLAHLQLKPSRVAVELNREIVSRSRHAEVTVNAGDMVEIVSFIGGG